MDEMIPNLATVIALFLTVGAPIIKLNSTMVKAIARIDSIEERQKENKETLRDMKEKSRLSHQKLHSRIDDVVKDVDELEDRVSILEKR